MILEELNRNSHKSKMPKFRKSFEIIKKLVVSGQHHAIDPKFVKGEKEKIISQLNNCEDDNMFEQFEQLAFYQQRYTELEKFLAPSTSSKANIQKLSQKQLVENFQKSFSMTEQYTRSQQNPQPQEPKQRIFREVDDIKIKQESRQHKEKNANMSNLNKAGLGGAIFQFFQKKQQELRHVGFKDLIEKKENASSISGSGFRKKPKRPNTDFEIRKLLDENKRLHQQLEKKSKQDSELNQFEKNVLREQKQRCMKRIQELEEEVEQLAIHNYKYKEMQKEKKQVSTFINDSLRDRDEMYTPYYIPTRYNDLEKISRKSKSPHGKKSQLRGSDSGNGQILNLIDDIPPINKVEEQSYSFDRELQKINSIPRQKDDNLILQDLLEEEPDRKEKNIFCGVPEKEKSMEYRKKTQRSQRQINYNKINNSRFNDSMDKISKFDSFSIAQTAYNNSSLFLNASKNLAAIDSVTSTRNKVAFFKKSLVIVKENDYQIAFKRSDMNSAMQKIRLIFYIQNKTHFQSRVDINYDYELDYYRIQPTQKLSRVPPQSQARQVIEVQLAPTSRNLNSVIDVHFSIGEKRYDLWVPACFIQWSGKGVTDQTPRVNMIVQPDRQFSNYENANKILPLTQPILVANDEKQAYLFGRSKFGNHQVKLSWWQKQLTIESGESILDFLGFVMHHFK